ncbi:MAG: hypothetical protein Q9220_001807 [cf. Caloplaca sp. 1 TL-2023]
MPGGKWHRPFFTPYALYGTVDYMYGWPAFDAGNGFTSAQGSMNVLESIGYVIYLYVFWKHGQGRWTYANGQLRSIGGGWGGIACLSGFSLALVTFSKTMLYVLPPYMIYVFGIDVLRGLSMAGGDSTSKPARVAKFRARLVSKENTPTRKK